MRCRIDYKAKKRRNIRRFVLVPSIRDEIEMIGNEKRDGEDVWKRVIK